MEIGDFSWLLIMIAIFSFPFAIIYLILFTLNWNDKKNIFSDSWFVFIAWFVSSLLMFFVNAIFNRMTGRITFPNQFLDFISTFVLSGFGNLISIFGVLYIRSRPNSALIGSNSNELKPPTVGKTLQAAFAVYFLTWLMIIGLTMAMTDIDERYFQPKQDEIEFGIYD